MPRWRRVFRSPVPEPRRCSCTRRPRPRSCYPDYRSNHPQRRGRLKQQRTLRWKVAFIGFQGSSAVKKHSISVLEPFMQMEIFRAIDHRSGMVYYRSIPIFHTYFVLFYTAASSCRSDRCSNVYKKTSNNVLTCDSGGDKWKQRCSRKSLHVNVEGTTTHPEWQMATVNRHLAEPFAGERDQTHSWQVVLGNAAWTCFVSGGGRVSPESYRDLQHLGEIN